MRELRNDIIRNGPYVSGLYTFTFTNWAIVKFKAILVFIEIHMTCKELYNLVHESCWFSDFGSKREESS